MVPHAGPPWETACRRVDVDVMYIHKKAAMIELLRSKLMLPNDGDAPRLPCVEVDVMPTDSASVMDPTAPDLHESGSDEAA